METVAGHIKSAIAARLSPESKHSRDDTMVANNKHGDGRGEREDQNSDSQQVGDENLVVKEPTASHGCKVNFLTSKSKRELVCMLCWKKFCSACSKLKKKAVITGILCRPDVMRACVSCLDLIKSNQSKIRIDSNEVNNEKETTSSTADFYKRLRELEVSVETKIEETVRAIITRVLEQCQIPTMTKSVETSPESSVNKKCVKSLGWNNHRQWWFSYIRLPSSKKCSDQTQSNPKKCGKRGSHRTKKWPKKR